MDKIEFEKVIEKHLSFFENRTAKNWDAEILMRDFAYDILSIPVEKLVSPKTADEIKLEVLKEIKKEVAEKQQKLYESRVPYAKDDCWEIVEDIDSQIKLLEGVIKGISYKIDKLEKQ